MKYRKIAWALEKLVNPSKYSKGHPHTNIRWVSYHIPKTAGSSLRASLEQNYPSQVFGAYASTGAKEISRGEPLWLPKHCRIIHGHFKPHESHLEVFPNSKRMVWVRESCRSSLQLSETPITNRRRAPTIPTTKKNIPYEWSLKN